MIDRQSKNTKRKRGLNRLKKINEGFTMIELVVVILLIGILSMVAVPRFERRIELEELRFEKRFTYQIWEELELYAKEQKELTGIESWPEHPLSVLGRTRGVIITLPLGIPDEDNEWQFSLDAVDEPAIFHQRPSDEIYYYTYDSTNFELSEIPVLYTTQ